MDIVGKICDKITQSNSMLNVILEVCECDVSFEPVLKPPGKFSYKISIDW